ncbi:DNA-binding response regulator [Deltaproteobacteria bacterium Smac51]|nr:DNA-binding response regulator [Deltaproteobacteria bacterium Smac51]
MPTTIILVDDHAVVREGIGSLLKEMPSAFEVVGEAADGPAAIELVREMVPDMVLLDLMMPQMDGVSVVRAIKTASPRTYITVLTSAEEDELAFAAIEAGAQSFLLKSMLGDELLSTLLRIAGGEDVIHPFVAKRILKVVRSSREPVPNPFAALTDRELEVLRELAEGGSNARIAQKLHISETTVKSHISNVLGKLHLNDRTEAVAYAWRKGLLKPGQGPGPHV